MMVLIGSYDVWHRIAVKSCYRWKNSAVLLAAGISIRVPYTPFKLTSVRAQLVSPKYELSKQPKI